MHGNLERVVFLSPQIKLAYSYGWLWKFFRANHLGGGGVGVQIYSSVSY
jgi:hypothetical protein